MVKADSASLEPITSELFLRSRPLAQQLRWLIGIRLVVITSLVLPFFFFQLGLPASGERFELLYLIAGLTYLVSLGYILLLRWLAGREVLQAHIQFAGDLVLITGLVYNFGGLDSPFSIFYFVVIIVAGAMLSRRGALTVAAMAWILYGLVVLGLSNRWLALPDGTYAELPALSTQIYASAAHLFGFFAVAMLSSHLAQSVVQAERALLRKGRHLADLQVVHRDVIESIPSGLITTDLEGGITSGNRAAEVILGRGGGELRGSSVTEIGLLSPRQWSDLVGGDPDVPRDRLELRYERGGNVHTVGYALTPLTSAEGALTGYTLIFQDLTEWRKLQHELRMKDRMAAVGELAAGIAHEIGNPLAAISGSVQMLTASFDGPPSQTRLLDIILKESQRLDRTIKNFLKFARPKDRTSVRFDIAELLAENLKLLRHSPEVGEAHWLELELDPPSVSLLADPDQVSQIFWNLARNALRAMPDGGTLTVLGQLRGSNYQMVFSDTGRGMTEEERNKLFHPFHSFFDGGTGIGMAIVYRIVEEHGGRLLVESVPGRGSEITVELPVASAAALAEAG